MKRSRFAIFAIACGIAACSGSDSSGPKAGPPASVTVVSGSGQSGQSGQALPQPLIAKVLDKDGKAVSKALVTFTIAVGGGTLSATLDTTDADGIASVTWTLGQSVGEGRVEAHATGVVAPAVFLATVQAGPPAAIDLISNAIGTAAAGFDLPDSVAVKVSDQFGHALPGVSVAFAVTAGGGKVSANPKTSDADGIARVMWTIGPSGTQTLTASVGTLQSTISGLATTCPEVSMTVGQAMTIQPSAAQCLVLAGTGQRYFVTVTNPTNSPTSTSNYYVRGAGASLSADSTALAGSLSMLAMRLPASTVAALRNVESGRRAHARAMQANYSLMSRMPLAAALSNRSASIVAAQATLPNVGDIVSYKIPKNFNNLCDNSNSTSPDAGSAKVAGRVVYVGTHAVLLEDTTNSPKGTFDTLYAKVGKEFDDVMWPILTNNFGSPLAMETRLGNVTDHEYMVFSHAVNEMQQGNLAGFVSSSDFYPVTSCPTSNVQATFYARVPTSTNVGFDSINSTQTPDEWYRTIRTVIIHESKHDASFAEKFALNNGAYPGGGFGSRDQWLEESSAMLAEELWARTVFGYAQFGNVTYRQSIYCEVRPRPNFPECQPTKPTSLVDHFFYLYGYARTPEALSVVGPVSSSDFTFYGAGWNFLRWVVDEYAASEPTFLSTMTKQVTYAGTEEIEQLANKPFPDLFAEFSIALALDDDPSFAPANAKLKEPSWNTRDIFAGLNGDFGNVFPTPTPLNVRAVSFGKFSIDVSGVHGGGMSLLQLTGTQSAKQLLEFKGAAGTAFPAEMRISVVRVQ